MKLFAIAADFVGHLFRNRNLVYELTKREFQKKYIANVLGLGWAVLEPLAFMMILWLVFGIGMRGGRNMEIPYVVYLISGIAVFMFFSQALSQGTMGIKTNAFLVNKVNFRFSILPLVKILAGTAMHVIVVSLVILISLLKGQSPNLYWLQLPYYTFALAVFILGLSWLTSSIVLFIPDVSNLVQIVVRFLFYLSPIFWSIDMFPENYHFVFKLNPVYYIMTGYRNSLYFRVPFWQEWELGLYFWGLTFIFLLLGMVTFSKLKPHFADVV